MVPHARQSWLFWKALGLPVWHYPPLPGLGEVVAQVPVRGAGGWLLVQYPAEGLDDSEGRENLESRERGREQPAGHQSDWDGEAR